MARRNKGWVGHRGHEMNELDLCSELEISAPKIVNRSFLRFQISNSAGINACRMFSNALA